MVKRLPRSGMVADCKGRTGNDAFLDEAPIEKRDKLIKADDRELIKAVAMDIGKQVANYIEIQYPEAVKAASSTFLLSVRNCTSNEIMAAIESDMDVEKRLRFNDKFRRHIRKQWKKIRGEDDAA